MRHRQGGKGGESELLSALERITLYYGTAIDHLTLTASTCSNPSRNSLTILWCCPRLLNPSLCRAGLLDDSRLNIWTALLSGSS